MIAGGLLTYLMGGPILTAIVLVPTALILSLYLWLFRPRWWGDTKVQAISITVLGGLGTLAMADMLWWPPFVNLYSTLRARYTVLPDLQLAAEISIQDKLWVLFAVGVFFVIFHLIWARRRTLPPPSTNGRRESPFPVKGYEKLRDEFCRYMLGRLDQDDADLNWSDSDYTALEAEVEADRHGARRPRVERDLVAAIRRDYKTRAFLLLGDPGSGKSVSLRRLCRQLYGEVKSTGIVPIYVNLREWVGPVVPTDKDISDFIKDYLKQVAGRAGKRFLNEWYEPMLRHGRFFFLLDSFDEMPAVLDCDDLSPKLKEISSSFDRFFHDIHQCRGVLASRRFRQPRGLKARRLSVRPFRESQIREAMARWMLGEPLNAEEIMKDLFRNRAELAPVVRNPFLADLMTGYLIRHGGQLPLNQFAIYDDYIRQRLVEDKGDLRDIGVSAEQLLDGATAIAWAMYVDSSVGLEVETYKLAGLICIEGDFDKIVRALRLVRLIRLGGSHSQRLSFVHRRFAEFFAARAIVLGNHPIPLEAIPEDSRWRDCLVVYCGVAPEDRVQPLADYCWRLIENSGGSLDQDDVDRARPIIHCMRFLRDAFIARPQFIEKFRHGLEARVRQWLKSKDLLAAKIAAEMLGILGPAGRSEGVVIAFTRQSLWLRETALTACRHLGSLDRNAQEAIRRHVKTIPALRLILEWRDLAFSFSLSDDLRGQARSLRMDLLWLEVLWVSFLVGFVSAVFATSRGEVGLIIDWMFVFLMAILMEFRIIDRSNFTRASAPKVFRLGFDTSLRLVAFLFFLVPSVPVLLGWEYPGKILDWFEKSLEASRRDLVFDGRDSFKSSILFGDLRASDEIAWLPYCLFVIGCLALPWDLWPDLLRRALKILKFEPGTVGKIRDVLLKVVKVTSVGALGFALVGGLIWALFNLISGRLLQVLSLVLSPVALLMFIVPQWGLIRDWLALRNHGFTVVTTRVSVRQVCSRLRTSWGRARFLEALRLRGVDVSDNPLPLPDEPWVDDRVREGLARLEAKWLGLEE
jgi:hypothetical protein